MQASPRIVLYFIHFENLQEVAGVRELNRGGGGTNEHLCTSQVSASIITPAFGNILFRLCPIFRISNVNGDGLDYVG